jgi:hypothetical protein
MLLMVCTPLTDGYQLMITLIFVVIATGKPVIAHLINRFLRVEQRLISRETSTTSPPPAAPAAVAVTSSIQSTVEGSAPASSSSSSSTTSIASVPAAAASETLQ